MFSNVSLSSVYFCPSPLLSPQSYTSSVLLVLQVFSSLLCWARRDFCTNTSLIKSQLFVNPLVTSSAAHSPQSLFCPFFCFSEGTDCITGAPSEDGLLLLALRMKSTLHATDSNLQGRPCTTWLICPGRSSGLSPCFWLWWFSLVP